jgi:hypothetical protein
MNGVAEMLDQRRILVGIYDHSSIRFVGYFKKIFILREHRKTRRLARYVFSMLGGSVRGVGVRKSENFSNGS